MYTYTRAVKFTTVTETIKATVIVERKRKFKNYAYKLLLYYEKYEPKKLIKISKSTREVSNGRHCFHFIESNYFHSV